MGCDDKVIAHITGKRTRWQRLLIREAYVNVDDGKNRDLLKDLRSELGGKLKKPVLKLYSDDGLADAQWAKEAMEGMGHNSELLCEIIATRFS